MLNLFLQKLHSIINILCYFPSLQYSTVARDIVMNTRKNSCITNFLSKIIKGRKRPWRHTQIIVSVIDKMIYLSRPAVIPEISAACKGLFASFGADDNALLDV